MSMNSQHDLEGMKRVGAVAAEALKAMKEMVLPNVTPAELNRGCEEIFKKHNAFSAPALVYGARFTLLFLSMLMLFTGFQPSVNYDLVMSLNSRSHRL